MTGPVAFLQYLRNAEKNPSFNNIETQTGPNNNNNHNHSNSVSRRETRHRLELALPGSMMGQE